MTETERLLQAPLYSSSVLLGRAAPELPETGVSAWWFKNSLGAPVDGCVQRDGKYLLYVGISPRAPSPAGKPLAQKLISRIRYHFTGNADGSTLRFTIGCLLGLELRRVGSGKHSTFAAKEDEISRWLQSNVYVSFIDSPEPWAVEEEILKALSLPFNLDQNRAHPYHATLTEMRAKAKKRAIKLAIATPEVPKSKAKPVRNVKPEQQEAPKYLPPSRRRR